MKKVRKKKMLYDSELFNLFREAFPEADEQYCLEAVHDALSVRFRFGYSLPETDFNDNLTTFNPNLL